MLLGTAYYYKSIVTFHAIVIYLIKSILKEILCDNNFFSFLSWMLKKKCKNIKLINRYL